ncbi:hypothetical protein HMPREF6745_0390 [Prevotella sp. oral taxon 472 str. F0295]|nr:hypothetical protein HMPREF6745_0390 [Prevotella sp. oral taxon 472 str. F0295]
MRGFGIRENRYASYRVTLAVEIAISSSALTCSKGMVSYPELAS